MADSLNPIILDNILSLHENPELIVWAPFREGVDIHPIYRDEDGCSAALLKYQPGSRIPAHQHEGYEHILILSGEQSDDENVYTRGQLVIHPPGSSHSIYSKTGCIVMAIWEKPVKFF